MKYELGKVYVLPKEHIDDVGARGMETFALDYKRGWKMRWKKVRDDEDGSVAAELILFIRKA